MPQFLVTFKDGEKVPVMAANQDEARIKARSVRRFRGENDSGNVKVSGPNSGFTKHPQSEVGTHTFVPQSGDSNLCTKCGKPRQHISHARTDDGEWYR